MANIADHMTLVSWLRAKTDLILDLTDDFIYATLLHRGVTDDETKVGEVDERTRDLILADTYYGELNHYGMYWLKWADVRR